MADLWYVISQIRHQRVLLPCALVLTAARCALALWLPLLMADAIEAAALLHDVARVGEVGLRMLVATVAMGIFSYGSNLICAVIGQRYALDTRQESYARIGELSVLQAAQIGYGSLITRLTVDIDTCANLLYALVQLLVEPTVLVVGGIVMMWHIAPRLGMVFVGFVLLQLIVMVTFVSRTAPGFLKVRRRTDALNARLQSSLANFRLMKATNTQRQERERVDSDNVALFDAAFAVQRKIALFNPLVMLIMNVAVACVLLLAGVQVQEGSLHVARVLSAVSYSEQVLLSIAAVGHIYRVMTETQPSAARIRELLDTKPQMTDGELVWDGSFCELCLEHVAFSYPEGSRVFDDLSLRVRGGESVAVVGPIGCGKTTLASLCNRLHDPASGRVLLNSHDLRMWRIEDVRRAVALVEKRTAVLEDTMRDNIVFGREGIDEQDVSEAVRVAQLSELVAKQPEGLDTLLYSMGRSLSGGERQRLTIARALAGRPGLLVLDDSTSSLDYVTETQLLADVRRTYPQMAVMLITNRLASALKADRIVVLGEGRIEAEGTDAELRATSSLYQRMCAVQEGGR